jgi:CDP-glucose 4,6-dehydratase
MDSFYKGKTVLVTGDTGFKGSWLSLWLHHLGANVIGYSLPPVNEDDHYNLINLSGRITHIDGNLLDYDLLKSTFDSHKPEIVFHLAAQAIVRQSYSNPRETFETNVAGSVNVLEAIRHSQNIRSVIFVTSDKAYKNKEWIWGYRENDELGGHDPYSASKAAAEIVFSSYCDSFFDKNIEIGLSSVRAGNVIGGADWAQDRIIPDCIRSVEKKQDINIRNPHAVRPWQHVLEPLSGYMLLAQKMYSAPKKFSGAWNFGPSIKSFKTVLELVEEVVNVYSEGEISVNSNSEDPHEASLLHLNCDKANNRLEWNPKWGFEETVRRTINWYKNYKSGNNAFELTLSDIKDYQEVER